MEFSSEAVILRRSYFSYIVKDENAIRLNKKYCRYMRSHIHLFIYTDNEKCREYVEANEAFV